MLYPDNLLPKNDLAPIMVEERGLSNLLEIHRQLTVLKGQLRILKTLEMQIRGWYEWTDELQGHWDKVTGEVLRDMRALAECATRVDVEDGHALCLKARIFLDAYARPSRG